MAVCYELSTPESNEFGFCRVVLWFELFNFECFSSACFVVDFYNFVDVFAIRFRWMSRTWNVSQNFVCIKPDVSITVT